MTNDLSGPALAAAVADAMGWKRVYDECGTPYSGGWLEEHEPHGTIEIEDIGHPSRAWVLRRCSCGASHVGPLERE